MKVNQHISLQKAQDCGISEHYAQWEDLRSFLRKMLKGHIEGSAQNDLRFLNSNWKQEVSGAIAKILWWKVISNSKILYPENDIWG